MQKATELGVTRRSRRQNRAQRRQARSRDARRAALEHWARIARSACEQSGGIARRDRGATTRWPHVSRRCRTTARGSFFIPDAAPDRALAPRPLRRSALLVGPEGGFSPTDLDCVDAARLRCSGVSARACCAPRRPRSQLARWPSSAARRRPPDRQPLNASRRSRRSCLRCARRRESADTRGSSARGTASAGPPATASRYRARRRRD